MHTNAHPCARTSLPIRPPILIVEVAISACCQRLSNPWALSRLHLKPLPHPVRTLLSYDSRPFSTPLNGCAQISCTVLRLRGATIDTLALHRRRESTQRCKRQLRIATSDLPAINPLSSKRPTSPPRDNRAHWIIHPHQDMAQ
jgi:hypothetical protein